MSKNFVWLLAFTECHSSCLAVPQYNPRGVHLPRSTQSHGHPILTFRLSIIMTTNTDPSLHQLQLTLTKQTVAQIQNLGKSFSFWKGSVGFCPDCAQLFVMPSPVIQRLQCQCWLTDSWILGKRKARCWESGTVGGVNLTHRCTSSKSRSRFKCVRPSVTRVPLQWQLIARLALLQWLYSYVNIEMSRQKYLTDCSAIASVGKTYENLVSPHI